MFSGFSIDLVFLTKMEAPSNVLIDVGTVEACSWAGFTGGPILEEAVEVVPLLKCLKGLPS